MEKERPIDRIKKLSQWLIDHKVLKSQYAFEKVCGLSKRYVKNLSVTAKGNPSIEVVAQIYEVFPGMNLEWMVTGKGEMWKKKGTDEEIVESVKKQLLTRLMLLM